MKKKVVWVVVTGWLVVALLLASCAPAVVEKEVEEVALPKEKEEAVVPKEVVVPKAEANLVKWTGKKLDGTVVEKMMEKPRYGGVLIAAWETQPTVFDAIGSASAWNIQPSNEELLNHDWARGTAGTEEWQAQLMVPPISELAKGILAESWEIPDDTTLVWHIRKGVHWQNKPPMNGREFTADDVLFSLRRALAKGTYNGNRTPFFWDENQKNIYISPTDKWAVIMKLPPAMVGIVWEGVGDTSENIVPPEVIEKYGNMNDWKNVVGTGPFILKEYVGASSLTWVRNPNYWMRDPFFPENQLPYLDSLKVLIIPDLSTRLSALRTGKIDRVYGLEVEDAEPLLKSNPELERQRHLGGTTPLIAMRVDKPELPFHDARVRQALAMAINNYEIRDVYYGGNAELNQYPLPPIAEYKDMYRRIEEMPQSVRELYEYHPDKARQLLAEAGYPQGFKTEVLVSSAATDFVDLLQIIKEYWTKIGIDLKIDVRDAAVVSAMTGVRKTYAAMYMTGTPAGNPWNLTRFRAGSVPNNSMINDPRIEKDYLAINAVYFDQAKKFQLIKELDSYILEQAYHMTLPTPNEYTLWQPWLKGYYGAIYNSYVTNFGWPRYVWIDQELKQAMGR